MASITGNSELTRFDNTFRLMGLNNSIFNTNDLVEAEIQILELQSEPLKTQKKYLDEEKAVWNQFKTAMTNVTDTFQSTRLYAPGQKQVNYSNEGFITFDASANSISGNYAISVSQLAEKHQIAGKDLGSSSTVLGIEDTMKLNGVDLAISNDMTLRDVVNTINNGTYGASASIISNRLVITSKESGIDKSLTLNEGANGGFESLGVMNSSGGISNELKAAQNAKYSINGIELESNSNVASTDIEGVNITLNKTTMSEVKVSVSENTTGTISKIEEFVNSYNKAISTLMNYTDKGTYLQGQSLPLQLRRSLGEITNFTGKDGSRLYEAGIEIDGVMKNGTLALDKSKLEEALKNNPKKVEEMFFGEKGAAKFMKDKLDNYTSVTGSISGAIDGLTERIKKIDKSLDTYNVSYERQKESILKKYAAFETMMAGLNSQMSYMEAQMKALNGSSD